MDGPPMYQLFAIFFVGLILPAVLPVGYLLLHRKRLKTLSAAIAWLLLGCIYWIACVATNGALFELAEGSSISFFLFLIMNTIVVVLYAYVFHRLFANRLFQTFERKDISDHLVD